MASGEEFLLRPVKNGLCKYESLIDGTLSLEDFARMNDYLDVCEENQARYEDAMKDG